MKAADSEKATIESILARVWEYNPNSNQDLIRKAYDLACQSHVGQKRDSGEDYIVHPLEVAGILADLQIDDFSLAAGFLHDVVEDTSITLEYIRKEFGPEIMTLVDGVTKLSRLENRTKREQQADNLRKMFLAMSEDIRIILVKLADRLHNMRTLGSHHSELRKKEIAQETLDIFAPLAHRLGISKIQWELEDLALKYLEPEKYNTLVSQISSRKQEQGKTIQQICDELQEHLAAINIKATINSRSKNYYSIYTKMQRQQKELDEIYDVSALRIIVDNVKNCYGALGVVHTLWKPIPGRFKDYIAMPKDNMYQSIHTTLIGPKGNPFEVQIRTWEMHRISEYGIAAHWRYKEGKSGDVDFDKKMSWLRQMLEWQQEMRDANEFMESVKVDLFVDSVFVFSPKGDVYELPAGASPIDFAYRVHTQIGHQCVGAKVNQRIATLDYPLHNGDIVEILTAKGSGPSWDWLKIVKTSQAKNKIRQYFRRENREDNLQAGHQMIELACLKQSIDANALLKNEKITEVAKRFSYVTGDDLLLAVEAGVITPLAVISKVKEDANLRKGIIKDEPEPVPDIKLAVKPFSGNAGFDNGIWVKGEPGVMVRIAHCCNPLPGDPIIGYITRGRGVSVHRQDCPNVLYYKNNELDRLVETTWGNETEGVFQAEILVKALESPRVVADAMSAISETKTLINGVRMLLDKNRMTTIYLKIEISNLDQLEYLMSKVRRVKDVLEVTRLVNEKHQD